jgi:hypothetical protein
MVGGADEENLTDPPKKSRWPLELLSYSGVLRSVVLKARKVAGPAAVLSPTPWIRPAALSTCNSQTMPLTGLFGSFVPSAETLGCSPGKCEEKLERRISPLLSSMWPLLT